MRLRLAATAAALAAPALAMGGAGGEPPRPLTAAAPLSLCLEPAPGEASRLPAVLAIFDPEAPEGEAYLSVRADTGEETRVGLFPDSPFGASAPGEPQRIFLPGGPTTRCWTVSLLGAGSAAVKLEHAEPEPEPVDSEAPAR